MQRHIHALCSLCIHVDFSSLFLDFADNLCGLVGVIMGELSLLLLSSLLSSCLMGETVFSKCS